MAELFNADLLQTLIRQLGEQGIIDLVPPEHVRQFAQSQAIQNRFELGGHGEIAMPNP